MSEFKTSDIILAACLKITEANMVKIELNGNKGTFIFEDVDAEYIDDYDLGKCLVEPVTFNNAVKQLTTSVRRMSNR